MANKEIKIGSEVMWRGGFGAAPARKAKVTGIEKCSRQRDKYGDPVDAIAWEEKKTTEYSFSTTTAGATESRL